MEINQAVKNEILSLLNGFYFDESWKERERPVTPEDIQHLNPPVYPMDFILAALTALRNEKLIDASVNNGQAVKDPKVNITLTKTGQEQACSLVELYWPKIEYWKTKYPKLERLMVPQFDEEDDWLMFEMIAKTASFANAYTMDETKILNLLAEIKPNPAPGRFMYKVFQLNGRVLQRGNRNPPGKGTIQTWKLMPRYKNFFVEEPAAIRESLALAKENFAVLANMYGEIWTQRKKKEEFLELFKKHGGDLGRDMDFFFEALGNLEILGFDLENFTDESTDKYMISLNHDLGHHYYGEWEHHFLRHGLNPQSDFYYQLGGNADVKFNRALRQFVVLTSADEQNQVDMMDLMDEIPISVKEEVRLAAESSMGNGCSPKKPIVEWLERYVKSDIALEQYLGTFQALNSENNETKFQHAASSARECVKNTLEHIVSRVMKKTDTEPQKLVVNGTPKRTRKGDARYLAGYFCGKKGKVQAERFEIFADQVDYAYTVLSAGTHAGISDKERENKAMAGLTALETVLFQLMDWESLDEPLASPD